MPRPTVVFDLDGTLVHSLPGLARSLDRALALRGRRPLDESEVARMIGDGAPVLVRRALEATGGVDDLDAALADFLRFYDEDALRWTELRPGALELLSHLRGRGVRLALCTNKPRAPTLALLRALDLARFFGDAVVGGDEAPGPKPAAAPLLEAIRRTGGSLARAALVGDSPVDAATARAAGLPVVLVEGGYSRRPLRELGADAVVPSLAAVPVALAALGVL